MPYSRFSITDQPYVDEMKLTLAGSDSGQLPTNVCAIHKLDIVSIAGALLKQGYHIGYSIQMDMLVSSQSIVVSGDIKPLIRLSEAVPGRVSRNSLFGNICGDWFNIQNDLDAETDIFNMKISNYNLPIREDNYREMLDYTVITQGFMRISNWIDDKNAGLCAYFIELPFDAVAVRRPWR